MPTALEDPKEYQKIFHWAETQKDGSIPSFGVRKNDPYEVRELKCSPPIVQYTHSPHACPISTC